MKKQKGNATQRIPDVILIPNLILLLLGVYIIYASKLDMDLEGYIILLGCLLPPITSFVICKIKKIDNDKKNKSLTIIVIMEIIIFALIVVWVMWPSINNSICSQWDNPSCWTENNKGNE